MKTSPTLLIAALCAVFVGAVHGQTATSAKLSNAFSFNYDAQNDRISTGVQLKPTATSAAGAAANTTGTIVVTINIDLVSKFASSVTYHCSVAVIGGELDTGNDAVAGGMETASEAASGKTTKSCTLTIPYSWTLPADSKAETGLILAFGVGAVSSSGTVLRSTLQVDGIESLPATGTKSTYTFDATL